jgi:PHD/YefM family antitoxin component YafN of YafNO toxin-antitoxin module
MIIYLNHNGTNDVNVTVGDFTGEAMIIYLNHNGTNDGNVTIMGHTNPDRVTMSMARYGMTDGYDLYLSLSLRPEVARQIAAALQDAADKLCDAHDLPPNARVVADRAAFTASDA